MISKLIDKLKNKEYRDLFVSGQIKTGIPFQLRAMRDQRKWTQEEVGKRAGLPQSTIARLENPDTVHSPNIKTLVKLASIFDVALIVRFTPYVELAYWAESAPYEVKGLSYEALAVRRFDEERQFLQRRTEERVRWPVLSLNTSEPNILLGFKEKQEQISIYMPNATAVTGLYTPTGV